MSTQARPLMLPIIPREVPPDCAPETAAEFPALQRGPFLSKFLRVLRLLVYGKVGADRSGDCQSPRIATIAGLLCVLGFNVLAVLLRNARRNGGFGALKQRLLKRSFMVLKTMPTLGQEVKPALLGCMVFVAMGYRQSHRRRQAQAEAQAEMDRWRQRSAAMGASPLHDEAPRPNCSSLFGSTPVCRVGLASVDEEPKVGFVDESTSLPLVLFKALLEEGRRARDSGQHVLVEKRLLLRTGSTVVSRDGSTKTPQPPSPMDDCKRSRSPSLSTMASLSQSRSPSGRAQQSVTWH